MSWNVNIPIRDGKVVAEEITVSGTLPTDTVIKANGHTQEGIGGYDSVGISVDGQSAYSSIQAKSHV